MQPTIQSVLSVFAFAGLLAITSALTPAQESKGKSGEKSEKSEPKQEAQPIEKVIGVVDLNKVFGANARYQQGHKGLQEKSKSVGEQLNDEEAKLKELKMQRDMFKRDSFDFAKANLELNERARRLDGMREIWTAQFSNERDTLITQTYQEIEKAVTAVAKEKGLKLVLRVFSNSDSDPEGTKLATFQTRTVWYAADEMDLTPAVIKLLQVPLVETPKADPPKEKDAGAPNGKK